MVPDKTKHCQMIGSLPEKKQPFPSASQVVIVHGRICFFRVIAGREKLQKHIIIILYIEICRKASPPERKQ